MRYFLDTEFFEDGKTIDLISIGIVAEDGRELYMESVEYDHARASADPWMAANVLPHIQGLHPHTRQGMRDHLLQFIGDERPEFWAYYADYDWVALCQLFGRMIDLPAGWPKYCRDIKQLAVSLGDPQLPAQAPDKEHSAIGDARWNKRAWEFLTNGASK